MASIRKNKTHKQYYFYPDKDNRDLKFRKFKYKRKLMGFINSHDDKAICSIIGYNIETFNSTYTRNEWVVWYDKRLYNHHDIFRLKLSWETFRGHKYICKKSHISKSGVKYFSFSSKIINLMAYIDDNIDKSSVDASLCNLLILFYKRGFRDFIIDDDETKEYYQSYINDGFNNIQWSYWSDRCNFLRCKIIYDLIKTEKPLVFENYNKWLKIHNK